MSATYFIGFITLSRTTQKRKVKSMINRTGRLLTELENNRVYQWLLLSLVVLVASALRFYKLGAWSFWGDEYITVEKALDVFGGGISRSSPSMLATHVVLNVLGVSEWSARLVAATVGIVSVPVLYFLVKRIFDPVVALFASFLLAVSPWHLYWSQNARFYTTLLLFYTIALLLFYLGMEEDRPWYLVFSLLFFGLALHERLVAAFLGVILFAYIVLLKLLPFEPPRGLRLANLALFFGPGLLGAVFLALTTPSIRDPSRWISSFGFVNNNPFWILGGVIFYLGIPLICMGTVGGLSLLLRRSRIALLLGLAAIVPIVSIMMIAVVQYSANRYIFVSLTSVIILASLATKELLWQAPKSSQLVAAGAVLILVLMPMGDNVLYYQFQNGNRDNWKAALAFIATQKAEGDLVVTSNRPLADYYLKEETVGMQSLEIRGLDHATGGEGRTWFVLDVTAPDKGPTVFQWAQFNAQHIRSFDVTFSARTFPMQVYLYDPEVALARQDILSGRP